MSQYKMKDPTPRRRRPPRQSPFPVLVDGTNGTPSGGDSWNYYCGRLVDNAVVISHSGDIDALYKKGCFGKASLSRFRPEYNHGFKGIGRNQRSAQEMLRVTSRRKYMRHLHWKQLQDPEPNADVNEDLEILPLPQPRTNPYKQPIIKDVDSLKDHSLHREQSSAQSPGKSYEAAEESYSSDQQIDKNSDQWSSCDPWGKTEADPWAEDDPMTSKQFWTTEGISEDQGKTGASEEKGKLDIDSVRPWEDGVGERTKSPVELEKHQAKDQRQKRSRESRSRFNKVPGQSNQQAEWEDPSSKVLKKDHNLSQQGDNEGQSAQTWDDSQTDAKSGKMPDEMPDLLMTFDPRSLGDEINAQLLVVEDSEDEEDCWSIADRLPWRPVAKRDPFPLKEHLHLALEEAFFLSFALGCLIVTDENEMPLNITEMWQRFCRCRPLFPYKYSVYHNFRSKGWVPKQGFKYGVDYVVYKEGPAYFHSSFCVQVRVVEEESLEEIKELNERKLTWSNLAGLNRVTEQVAKEVMICYVLKPSSLTEKDLRSPNCIKNLKIQETILQRWISSQERESSEAS